MRARSLILLAVLLVPGGAFAAETPDVVPEGFHQQAQRQNEQRAAIMNALRPEWQSCAKFQDCSIIAYDCVRGVSVALKYFNQARAAVCQIGDCSARGCAMPFDIVNMPDCVNGNCATRGFPPAPNQ